MNNSENNEKDLLKNWFLDLPSSLNTYKEPILEETTVNFIKHLCETLEQDSYVFILTVDILEEYIEIKEKRNEEITNETLIIAAIILICNKLLGVSLELNINCIEECLHQITNEHFNPKTIAIIEREILISFNGKLPMKSIMDDMNIIIEKYVQEMRLKVQIHTLCVKILDFLYIIRKQLFFELKQIYQETIGHLDAFKQLISCKYYLPSGILLSALKSTNYSNVLNLNQLTIDISNQTKIHLDHLNILTMKISKLIL